MFVRVFPHSVLKTTPLLKKPGMNIAPLEHIPTP